MRQPPLLVIAPATRLPVCLPRRAQMHPSTRLPPLRRAEPAASVPTPPRKAIRRIAEHIAISNTEGRNRVPAFLFCPFNGDRNRIHALSLQPAGLRGMPSAGEQRTGVCMTTSLPNILRGALLCGAIAFAMPAFAAGTPGEPSGPPVSISNTPATGPATTPGPSPSGGCQMPNGGSGCIEPPPGGGPSPDRAGSPQPAGGCQMPNGGSGCIEPPPGGGPSPERAPSPNPH